MAETDPYAQFLPDQGPPSAGVGSSAGDVAAQLGSRVAEGVVDLPGIVGDVDAMARDVGTWLARTGKLWFQGREAADQVQAPPRLTEGILPTSGEFKDTVGFQRRKPTTPAGKYVDNSVIGDIAEAGPAAILSGPKKIIEGGLRRIIPETTKAVAKRDAIPQVAGSKFQQGLEGLGVDPGFAGAARTVTELGLTGLSGVRERPNFVHPSIESMRDTGGALFRRAEQQGVAFSRPVFQQLVDDIDQTVRKMGGVNKTQAPQTRSILKELRDAAAGKGDVAPGAGPVTYREFNTFRQLASAATTSKLDIDKARAVRVVQILDKFMEQPPAGTFTGSPREAARLAREARAHWTQMHKATAIDDAFENARMSAQAQNFNEDAALRSAFRTILKDKPLIRKFTPQERAVVEEVVGGGRLEKAMKYLGGRWSIISSPFRAGALAYFAHHVGGEPAAAAALAAPEIARESVGAMTRRAAEAARAMVHRGDSRPIPLMPGLRPALRMGTYYAGDAQRREPHDPYAQFVPGGP